MVTTSDQLPDSSNQMGLRFQTSFAIELPQGPLSGIPGVDAGVLKVAYTVTTDLDALAESSPVWNIDHSPEVFWEWIDPAGRLQTMRIGWLHLSNGQSGELSRSVDRLEVEAKVAIIGGLSAYVRPWYTIATGENTHGFPEVANFNIRGNDLFGADGILAYENDRGKLVLLGGKDRVGGELWLPFADQAWAFLLRGHSGVQNNVLTYDKNDKAVGFGLAYQGW